MAELKLEPRQCYGVTDWKPGEELEAYAFPAEMVRDCTVPGQDAEEMVQYWIGALGITAPEDETREYLRNTGGWEDEDLQDHGKNVERLVWQACGDLNEDDGEDEGGPMWYFGQ